MNYDDTPSALISFFYHTFHSTACVFPLFPRLLFYLWGAEMQHLTRRFVGYLTMLFAYDPADDACKGNGCILPKLPTIVQD
jgi:hypothetical protein